MLEQGHGILDNFSYLAIMLSKADFGPLSLLSCCRAYYLPCGRKGSAWNG
jgi:hypothetical protein